MLSGVKSFWNYITAGVLQGSIFGPLLLDYVDNPDNAAEILNTDLNKYQTGQSLGY